jgi:hypothetical protein
MGYARNSKIPTTPPKSINTPKKIGPGKVRSIVKKCMGLIPK